MTDPHDYDRGLKASRLMRYGLMVAIFVALTIIVDLVIEFAIPPLQDGLIDQGLNVLSIIGIIVFFWIDRKIRHWPSGDPRK